MFNRRNVVQIFSAGFPENVFARTSLSRGQFGVQKLSRQAVGFADPAELDKQSRSEDLALDSIIWRETTCL